MNIDSGIAPGAVGIDRHAVHIGFTREKRCAAEDGPGGAHLEQSTIATNADLAACASRNAVGRIRNRGAALEHQCAVTGRPEHFDVYTVQPSDPAAVDELFINPQIQVIGLKPGGTGLGRCAGTGGQHIDDMPFQVETFGGLNIACHANTITEQGDVVLKPGGEVEAPNPGIKRVANNHANRVVMAMTDRDAAETSLQGGEVAHAEFHESGVSSRGQIHAQARLTRATNPVGLRIGLGMDGQVASASDAVWPGFVEVHIIGDDTDLTTTPCAEQGAVCQ